MEKILDVKNLRISFRTSNGTVKAVRNISFELNKGETLAIVGESGSGKSVTSRSIMGILAPNAIVESGEIIYDGQDLLKLPEEDFCQLRGENISMIFQDPLSSLNPIVKIGRQLTEAMIIKGRTRQKKMRKEFNDKLKLLNHYMDLATDSANKDITLQNAERIKSYDELAIKATTLENDYNMAFDTATELIDEISDFVFELEKKAAKGAKRTGEEIIVRCSKVFNDYVVKADRAKLVGLIEIVKIRLKESKATKAYDVLIEPLKEIKSILEDAVKLVKPNFFALGYYLKRSSEPVPALSVADLNKYLTELLEKEYLTEFKKYVKLALEFALKESTESKKKLLQLLKKSREFYNDFPSDKKAATEYSIKLIDRVNKSINYLDTQKDSLEYTFKTSFDDAVLRFYEAKKNNEKEIKRFDRESKKYEIKAAKGKKPDWEIVPANIIDTDIIKAEVLELIDKLIINSNEQISSADSFDSDKETEALLKYFENTASAVVHYVTPSMAKHRALKIMEEVGILEPRKRYNQYPFQFSGGMRQRIVIAIALSVLPDILICDEPTTALDVTIQSQILELINELKAKHKLSIIFITHDLGVVANMADRIAVMYAGKIVEYGTADDIFYSPAHPYTWALLSSMPDLNTSEKLEAIPGVPPNMIYPPKGDAFAARNKFAMNIDFEKEPPMFKISDTHYAATWLLHPDAPKVEMPKIVSERIKRSRQEQSKLSVNAAAESKMTKSKAKP